VPFYICIYYIIIVGYPRYIFRTWVTDDLLDNVVCNIPSVTDDGQECAQAHTNMYMPMENKNVNDYNFDILSALKRKYKLFYIHICICCGKGFVRPVIFTG
jgi:hypothetical protein